MSDSLKSSRRWTHAGWLLPLVMLALPNCFLDSTGLGGVGDDEFVPGSDPRSSAIMCDIPRVPNPNPAISQCADATDVESGFPLAYAAIALAQDEKSSLALDFSPAATGPCSGMPKKVEFQGPFPDGLTVCLNCSTQIPAVYVDANEACVAKCIDLTNQGEFEAPGGAQSFCEQNAKVSTNFDKNTCFDGACSSGGTPDTSFVDPRRLQELVKWNDLGGDATFDNNNLSKLTGVPGTFDSGAASEQLITHGDAWIEFAAQETGVSHVIGVRLDSGGPDTEPGLADIEFALSLNFDGFVYVLENGATYVSDPIEPYTAGKRYRIRITDNNNGTATISYTRIDGPCPPGNICNETVIATQTEPSPSYPLRISASFREPGATLANVTMVRIKDLP
jgi:hypothetical protein